MGEGLTSALPSPLAGFEGERKETGKGRVEGRDKERKEREGETPSK